MTHAMRVHTTKSSRMRSFKTPILLSDFAQAAQRWDVFLRTAEFQILTFVRKESQNDFPPNAHRRYNVKAIRGSLET